MYALGSKKMLAMGILQILKDYTDFEHRLTQQEIIDLLDKNYGMICDRKSVKSNILNLIEWGYEIENDKGWYLVEREFEDIELKMLIDSILYSKSIPANQAKMLIEKVKSLGNIYFESKMNHIVNVAELNHTDNKQALINICAIEEAIEKNKQIEFIYNTYGTDKKLHPRREEKYVVNPYKIVYSNNKPYLICNMDKYDKISNYRVDRMTDVNILDTKLKPREKVKELEQGLSIPKYLSERIYMFSDDVTMAKIKVRKGIMGEVVDWFGRDFTVREENEEEAIIAVKCSETALCFWALQYADFVEVLEPENVRERIKESVKGLVGKYQI